MKQITSRVSVILAFIYVFAMTLSSCSTSESVVNNNFLQKRKYNKGFHKSSKKKVKTNKNSSEEILVLNEINKKESIKKVNSLNKIEEVESVEVNLNEELVIEENTDKKISSKENTVTTKNKVIKALESKVEKVTEALKNKTMINKSSNTSNTSDDMMILLIILAILIPFVAVGIYTDWDVKKTVIALILTLLFWLPGMIYAFLTIFDKI